jgi:hypothetical protein
MLNVFPNAPTLRVYTHYKRKRTQTGSDHLRLPLEQLVPITSYSTFTGLLGDTAQPIPIAIIGNTSTGEGYRYACPTAFELYKANDTLLPGECHFASITREDSPCHLYFDFDCNPSESLYINRNGGISKLQTEFMILFTQAFVLTFKRPPVLTRDKRSGIQWENASSDNKISLHLHIVSEAFTNVNQYRQWVKHVLLPVINENGVLLKAGSTDRAGSTVLDGSVYTKNRAFRLLGSCKPGKRTLQYLLPPQENKTASSEVNPILLSLMGLTSYIIDVPRDISTGAILETCLLTFAPSSTVYPVKVNTPPTITTIEPITINWPVSVYSCLGITDAVTLRYRHHNPNDARASLFTHRPPACRLEWATTHAKLTHACRPYLPPAATQHTAYTLRTFLEEKGSDKSQANCTSFAGKPVGGCFFLQEADWLALLALSVTAPDRSNHIQQLLQLRTGCPPLRPLMFDLDLTGPSYIDITCANLPSAPDVGNLSFHTNAYDSILAVLCERVAQLTLFASPGTRESGDQRAFVASACGPTKLGMVKSSYHIVFPALLVTHEQVSIIRASLVGTIRSRIINLNKCQFDPAVDKLDVDAFIDKMIEGPTHGSRMLYQTKGFGASGSMAMYPLTVVDMKGQEDLTNVGWMQFSEGMNIIKATGRYDKPINLCTVPRSRSPASGETAAWDKWFNRIVFTPSLPLEQPSTMLYRDVRAATDKEQHIIVHDILSLRLGSSVEVGTISMSRLRTSHERLDTVTHARGVTKRNTAMCIFRAGHIHHSNRTSFTLFLCAAGWIKFYCFSCRKQSKHIDINPHTLKALRAASKNTSTPLK